MNFFPACSPSSPIRRASLIIGLAVFSLGAGGDPNSRYEFVKIAEWNTTVAGYSIQVVRPPVIAAADNIAFSAMVTAKAPPPAPKPKPQRAAPRSRDPDAVDPDAVPAAAAFPAAAAPQSIDERRGRVIFRYAGGKLTVASPLRDELGGGDDSFGLIGKMVFYPLGGGIAYFENGKETAIGFESQPHLSKASIQKVDAEGDTIAFYAFYPGPSGQPDDRWFEVCSFRNGRFKSVLKEKHVETAYGRYDFTAVGGDRVFAQTREALYASTDGEPQKLVSLGDEIGGRKLTLINGIYAGGDKIFFVGEHGDFGAASAIYTIRDGKPELFAAKPADVAAGVSWIGSLATNGETIVVVERLAEKKCRLVAHRGTEKTVIAETGDKAFGGELEYLVVGQRGIDSAGNIAFVYQLKNGTLGIGLAKVR